MNDLFNVSHFLNLSFYASTMNIYMKESFYIEWFTVSCQKFFLKLMFKPEQLIYLTVTITLRLKLQLILSVNTFSGVKTIADLYNIKL